MTGKVVFVKVGKANDKGEVWYYYQIQLPSGQVGNYNTRTQYNIGDIIEFDVCVNRENKLAICATPKDKVKS